jgi:hypothetical protein
MASYATFLACGGFEYDGPAGVIGFAPRLQADNFKTAFTAAEGWGSFQQKQTGANLEAGLMVKRGTVKLTTVKLALPSPTLPVRQLTVTYAGKPRAARHEVQAGAVSITLAEPVVLTAGNELTLVVTQ